MAAPMLARMANRVADIDEQLCRRYEIYCKAFQAEVARLAREHGHQPVQEALRLIEELDLEMPRHLVRWRFVRRYSPIMTVVGSTTSTSLRLWAATLLANATRSVSRSLVADSLNSFIREVIVTWSSWKLRLLCYHPGGVCSCGFLCETLDDRSMLNTN